MADIVAKLIDTTTCIGCKACEAACQEWNDNGFALSPPAELAELAVGYQTQPELSFDFWNLIVFNEREQGGQMSWLMSKYQCMHCVDPGCLKACPAPGAIFVRDNGIVDFDHDLCIGCGYCITGCPFDVPRRHPVTDKVYKCTLCSDRTAVGLEPACVKACPTSCLTFGTRDDMLEQAHARVEELKAVGVETAGVYDPPGVGGTNVLYVLAHADQPEQYGLPRDPHVPWTVRLWKGPLKVLGAVVFIGTIAAAALHYLRYGPKASSHGGE
jgi:formate dehydrogenase beta subunit